LNHFKEGEIFFLFHLQKIKITAGATAIRVKPAYQFFKPS